MIKLLQKILDFITPALLSALLWISVLSSENQPLTNSSNFLIFILIMLSACRITFFSYRGFTSRDNEFTKRYIFLVSGCICFSSMLFLDIQQDAVAFYVTMMLSICFGLMMLTFINGPIRSPHEAKLCLNYFSFLSLNSALMFASPELSTRLGEESVFEGHQVNGCMGYDNFVVDFDSFYFSYSSSEWNESCSEVIITETLFSQIVELDDVASHQPNFSSKVALLRTYTQMYPIISESVQFLVNNEENRQRYTQ